MFWIPAFAGMTMLLASVSSAFAADAPADPLPYGALARALTSDVAVPAYAKLPGAMDALASASSEFCLDPKTGSYPRLLAAFHAAMDAWQRAQPIAFGPIARNGRAARIEFWPDSGGSTDRQIRRALNERDPAMLADGGLAGKSVAVQNLATFERLLAEHAVNLQTDGAKDEDRYACAWMGAIAKFQAGLARAVYADWTGGYAAALIGADGGNALFADARSAATEYLKSLVGGLDVIISQKLERPLDSSLAKARITRAENWRTKRSLDNILANLETLRALFGAPGGFHDLLAAAGAAPLADGMLGGFDEAIAAARHVDVPLEDAVADSHHRPKVEELLRKLKALRTLAGGALAGETGLVVGFNSLDGD